MTDQIPSTVFISINSGMLTPVLNNYLKQFVEGFPLKRHRHSKICRQIEDLSSVRFASCFFD